jgi:beta-glucosidase/6-phospho-beta-glucosidase/beta-galactosidase
VVVPKAAIEYLRQHQQTAAQFDEMYGADAAQYFLSMPADLLQDKNTYGHRYRDVEGALKRAREIAGCLD